jgi:RNA polymerase sigma-70 factor, ECF subfamily
MDEPASDVIALAQGGDRAAREAVLAYLYPLLRKHLSFASGFHPEVDDWVQDALLAVLAALPRFEGRSSLKTWAMRIGLRAAGHGLRAARRRPAPTDQELDEVFELDPVARDELRFLSAALSQLAPKKRDAFVAMEILGMTAQEAGAALGTFANTAASRCRHARAELLAAHARREKKL